MTIQPSSTPDSVRLNQIASAAFGQLWPQHVSALTGINIRTLQRIRDAARTNTENSAATGALTGFVSAIEKIVADMKTANL